MSIQAAIRNFLSPEPPPPPPKMYVVKNLVLKTLGDTDREYAKFLYRETPTTGSTAGSTASSRTGTTTRATIGSIIGSAMDSPEPKIYAKHIIVLGAGIAGLQTALSLRTTIELHHIGVHIIAADVPGAHNEVYSSHQAGGHWRSYATTAPEDDRIRAWENRTYEYWTTMWRRRRSRGCEGLIPKEYPDAERWCGIGRVTARYFWGKDTPETVKGDGSGLWWRKSVKHFRTLNLDYERDRWVREKWEKSSGTEIPERVPEGAIMGIEYETFCFDPDTYLKRRMKLARDEFDVKVIRKKVPTEGGLPGVVNGAKKILLEQLNSDRGSCRGNRKGPKELKRMARAFFRGHPMPPGSYERLDDNDDDGDADVSGNEVECTETTEEAKVGSTSEKLFREEDIVAIINCTGLSARAFVGTREASLLYPTRGETIIVKGEARCCRTYQGLSDMDDDEIIYVVPRPGTKTTVFGGRKVKQNGSILPDENFKNRIIELIKKYRLAEELRTNFGKEFEIVKEYEVDRDNPREIYNRRKIFTIGFCPSRKGGPRVELESENGGKVEGTWILHNYGHGDSGFRGSVGCAEEIATLVKGLLLGDGTIEDDETPRANELNENPFDIRRTMEGLLRSGVTVVTERPVPPNEPALTSLRVQACFQATLYPAPTPIS
jgi:glycine/D-amino acid oxidase-like deaminating enzyme